MMQSNAKFYIKSTIASTATIGGTFTISKDIELNADLETGGESVSMVLKNGTQIERFEITATGGTGTIVKRGLTQAGTSTASVGLQKQWQDGTLAYVTALAFDILDKQGDTMTGPLKFSGTTNEGLVVNSLTTAQRTALTPDNGAIVYDTTLGENYQYIGGSWSAISAGSTQPNGSETVAGKFEEATQTENDNGASTGGTGADLVSTPAKTAATIQKGSWVYTSATDLTDTYTATLVPAPTAYTTGMRIRVKFTTANTGACTINLNSIGAKSIKLIDGTDPLDGDIAALGIYEFVYDGTNFVIQSVAVRASDSDASTGTNTVKFITPKQAKDNYGNNYVSSAAVSASVSVPASANIAIIAGYAGTTRIQYGEITLTRVGKTSGTFQAAETNGFDNVPTFSASWSGSTISCTGTATIGGTVYFYSSF